MLSYYDYLGLDDKYFFGTFTRQVGEFRERTSNYLTDNTHWLVGGLADTVLNVVTGPFLIPDALVLAPSERLFRGEYEAKNIPVLGPIGDSWGESLGTVVEEPSLVNICNAYSSTAGVVLFSCGVAKVTAPRIEAAVKAHKARAVCSGADNVNAQAANTGPSARTPVGRRGEPMNVPRGTNADTALGGRDYNGHALDQMQGRGVPPSAVENAIRTGTPTPDPIPGRIRHYDSVNKLTIITESDGTVVTVITGKR